MRHKLLFAAAFALLSVFTVISTPCFADEEGTQVAPEPTAEPTTAPPVHANADPKQEASHESQEDPASVEDKVEAESTPASEE